MPRWGDNQVWHQVRKFSTWCDAFPFSAAETETWFPVATISFRNCVILVTCGEECSSSTLSNPPPPPTASTASLPTSRKRNHYHTDTVLSFSEKSFFKLANSQFFGGFESLCPNISPEEFVFESHACLKLFKTVWNFVFCNWNNLGNWNKHICGSSPLWMTSNSVLLCRNPGTQLTCHTFCVFSVWCGKTLRTDGVKFGFVERCFETTTQSKRSFSLLCCFSVVSTSQKVVKAIKSSRMPRWLGRWKSPSGGDVSTWSNARKYIVKLMWCLCTNSGFVGISPAASV